jgi:hypothetical protein
MAMCEKCQKAGYDPKAMFIEGDQFIGVCCAGPYSRKVITPPAEVHVLPTQSDEIEYGIEVSNKVGVRAYANYQGLQLSFERSPQQLTAWAQRNGLMEKKTGT